MMRWSHTGSSSLMMCEDKKTVVPLCHGCQKGFEQLAPRQRVETGDRFVEEKQVGSLSDAQREGDECLLAERESTHPFCLRHLEFVQ